MKHFLTGLALLGTAIWLGQAPVAGADRDQAGSGELPRINDKTFVTMAAEAGMAEVNLGKLAARQAASADVRTFAQRMVRDHTLANTRLMSIATRKDLTVPKAMDRKHQDLMDRLGDMKGAAFDRAYMRAMVEDHRKAVALFQAEARNGKDSDLKDFASKTLPIIREHLKMAERMAGSGRSATGTSGDRR